MEKSSVRLPEEGESGDSVSTIGEQKKSGGQPASARVNNLTFRYRFPRIMGILRSAQEKGALPIEGMSACSQIKGPDILILVYADSREIL